MGSAKRDAMKWCDENCTQALGEVLGQIEVYHDECCPFATRFLDDAPWATDLISGGDDEPERGGGSW